MEPKTVRAGLILLIMYDKLQVTAFVEKLREYGYTDIEVCTDGKAALEKLKKIEPSVIISDVELKGEFNGIETGEKIRKDFNIPLIFLSRLQDESTFQKVRDTHPLAFLNKPINWNELRMAIESAVFSFREKASKNAVLDEYKVLFEKAPVPYYILDAEGNLTTVNSAWTELMGYSSDEIIGKWFGDFVSAGSHPKFKQCFDTLIKNGSIHDFEYELIKKDGQKTTVAFEGKVQYGPGREVLLVQCIINDITEKKKIKEKLFESEERFRLLFEEAPLGYQSLAENEGIIYVNNAWCKMLGYSKKEAIGKWFGDFLAPEERDGFKENFSVFRHKGKASDINYKMIKKGGGEIYIMIDGSVQYDEKGNYIQSHCILKDITMQKLAEDALRESERKLKEAQKIGRIGSWEFDVEHGEIEWSDETYELYERDLALGPPTSDEEAGYYSSEQSALLHDNARRAIENGEQFEYDLQAKLPSGRTAFFSASMLPIRDKSGRTVKLVGTVQDITARKKTEKELYESRQMLQTVLDTIPAAVFWKGHDLLYKGGNRTWLDSAGLRSSEEVVGKSDYDLPWDKEQANSFREIDKRIMESGIPEFDIIEPYLRTEGTQAWARTNKVPLRDSEGSIVGILGTYEDITKRKQAEEALYISEAQLSNAMRIARLGYWEYDVAEDLFAFNDHFYTIFRTTAEQVGGYTLSSARYAQLFVHPDDMQMVSAEIQKALETTDPNYDRQIEHRMIYADGKTGYISVRFFIIKDNQGRTIKTYGANQDITDRKQTEIALAESETMLRSINENISDIVWRIDADTKITYLSTSVQKILDYQPDEILGHSILNFVAPEYHAAAVDNISARDALKRKDIPVYFEYEMVALDGSRIPMEVSYSAIHDKSGNLIGFAGVARDIRERKKTETELKASETRFRELFSNMSSGVTVYVYDPVRNDYLFRDINRAGMAIFLIKHKKDIMNKYLLDCFPGAKELGLWDTLNRVGRTGISEKVQNINYKDERLSLYVENFVYKLKTGELVAVYDDIKERMLAEQSIQRNYEKIKKLSRHMETIREEERKHIAGELHDELGQILTAIKMDIGWIRNMMPPERKGIKKRIGSTMQIIDEAIQSVRRLSKELRPLMLDDLGLLDTLKALIQEFESRANIKVRYKLPQQEPELIPGQEISVFRIIQESLTNIARHASATEVKLIIKERNDNLDLKIQDNGIGIPDEKVHSSESFGILNMRERIQSWGGDMEIKGITGKGTTITARIPLRSIKK